MMSSRTLSLVGLWWHWLHPQGAQSGRLRSCSFSSRGNKSVLAVSNCTLSWTLLKEKGESLPLAPITLGTPSLSYPGEVRHAAWPKAVVAHPAIGSVVTLTHIEREWREQIPKRKIKVPLNGVNGGHNVNSKCSLQRLCSFLFSYAFYQTSWFYFLLPQSHLRKSTMMSVLVAGWIKTLMILWSPYPSPGSVSPKEGLAVMADTWHTGRHFPLSVLQQTSSINHGTFSCAVQMWPQRPT